MRIRFRLQQTPSWLYRRVIHARAARSGQNRLVDPIIGLSVVLHAIANEQTLKKGTTIMANSPQAKKRARQNEKRFAINKARRSRIRTFLRKAEEAIASGDKEAAAAAVRAAQPELMRGVSKGVYHKNTASRKISRLTARVKALG